jgi:hypothetical protein
MAGSIWLLRDVSPLLSLPIGGIAYLVALLLIGTFSEEEKRLMRELLPFEFKEIFPVIHRMQVRKR